MISVSLRVLSIEYVKYRFTFFHDGFPNGAAAIPNILFICKYNTIIVRLLLFFL